MSIKQRLNTLERINRPRPYVLVIVPSDATPGELDRLRSEALAKAGVLESQNPLVVVLRSFTHEISTIKNL